MCERVRIVENREENWANGVCDGKSMENGGERLRMEPKIRTAKYVERSMGTDCRVRRIEKGMKRMEMKRETWRMVHDVCR